MLLNCASQILALKTYVQVPSPRRDNAEDPFHVLRRVISADKSASATHSVVLLSGMFRTVQSCDNYPTGKFHITVTLSYACKDHSSACFQCGCIQLMRCNSCNRICITWNGNPRRLWTLTCTCCDHEWAARPCLPLGAGAAARPLPSWRHMITVHTDGIRYLR